MDAQNSDTHCDYDVVIVGGGPVGCALALGLASTKRTVLLLDAAPEYSVDDPRTLALSFGSRLILERLQIWHSLAPCTEIHTIHVSHRGGFGSALLTAQDAKTPALGYVVPYGAVQRAFAARLQETFALQNRTNAKVTQLEPDKGCLRVLFEHAGRTNTVRTTLAVIADGGALARELAEVQERDYAQSAIVCNLTASNARAHAAFERFTDHGPVALLPREHGYAAIWTVSRQDAAELCSVAPDIFLSRLQDIFGLRAGKFLTVHDRAAFSLTLRVAKTLVLERAVLIGNAAQALHPVAGQGLNLGLRDAWELARMLGEIEGDVGADQVTRHFSARRARDRRSSVDLTDAMVRVFSSSNLALRWMRGCGLTFLDCMPPVKRKFMQQMMFGMLS